MTFIVIFRATIREVDEEYARTAARLRELALNQFGCLEFHAVTEGSNEIALSYWESESAIREWKAHPEHVLAQQRGREKWYASFSVQIAHIGCEYVGGK